MQEAERIYLPRVGSQVPPIYPGRRLIGDRTGIASRRDPLHEATAVDPTAVDAWRALAPTPGATNPDLDREKLARWVNSQDLEHQSSSPRSRWPWFLAWLALTSACWWLERSRWGRDPETIRAEAPARDR